MIETQFNIVMPSIVFILLVAMAGCGSDSSASHGGPDASAETGEETAETNEESSEDTGEETGVETSGDTGEGTGEETEEETGEGTESETDEETGDGTDTTDTEETSEPETDPEAAARVSGFIDTLPWGPETIDAAGKREELVDAIIKTCTEFAPPGDDWQVWCQTFLVAAACRESSLDVTSVNGDGNDPVVGLLQDRFSSTVQDYDNFGNKAALERIGCEWPDFSGVDWSNDGIEWVEWLQGVRCNIALGAWYYFINATGNGDPPCYAYQYCQGQGTGANLVVGMLSHLRGPAGANYDPNDPFAGTYVEWIKDWFDDMISDVPDPHPFIIDLEPNHLQYCE